VDRIEGAKSRRRRASGVSQYRRSDLDDVNVGAQEAFRIAESGGTCQAEQAAEARKSVVVVDCAASRPASGFPDCRRSIG
jgi:hypothetical protein